LKKIKKISQIVDSVEYVDTYKDVNIIEETDIIEVEESRLDYASSFNELTYEDKRDLLRIEIYETELKSISDLYNSFHDEPFLDYIRENGKKKYFSLLKNDIFKKKTALLNKLLNINDYEYNKEPYLKEKQLMIYNELLSYNMENPNSDFEMFFKKYNQLELDYE